MPHCSVVPVKDSETVSEIMNPTETQHCSKCADQVLRALYQLNVEAKKRAEAAEQAYSNGWKKRAWVESQRKKALYSLKRSILGEFVEASCVGEIQLHEIEDRSYYCIYVGDFSFHTPISEWDDPSFEVTDSKTLDSFDADSKSRSDHMDEREALERLTDQFESPNHHLESPFTHRDFRSSFIGWSYLPGVLKEGDRVPDRYLDDSNQKESFMFEIGDTFQTSKGMCEIVDRYHAYLPPLFDRSPLLKREAYDVLLDGEMNECINVRRIIDEWRILANSIADPVPNIDGRIQDMIPRDTQRRHAEISFEIGDIIELEPFYNDGRSTYCRMIKVTVTPNILFGECEPVPPSEEAPSHLAMEDIAKNVVAVHDEPPVQET